MCSNGLIGKLASQQVKEGPARKAWWNQEIRFEIERLKVILRDPAATDEEKSMAKSQIANYEEISAMAARPPADWVRQIDLLAS